MANLKTNCTTTARWALLKEEFTCLLQSILNTFLSLMTNSHRGRVISSRKWAFNASIDSREILDTSSSDSTKWRPTSLLASTLFVASILTAAESPLQRTWVMEFMDTHGNDADQARVSARLVQHQLQSTCHNKRAQETYPLTAYLSTTSTAL